MESKFFFEDKSDQPESLYLSFYQDGKEVGVVHGKWGEGKFLNYDEATKLVQEILTHNKPGEVNYNLGKEAKPLTNIIVYKILDTYVEMTNSLGEGEQSESLSNSLVNKVLQSAQDRLQAEVKKGKTLVESEPFRKTLAMYRELSDVESLLHSEADLRNTKSVVAETRAAHESVRSNVARVTFNDDVEDLAATFERNEAKLQQVKENLNQRYSHLSSAASGGTKDTDYKQAFAMAVEERELIKKAEEDFAATKKQCEEMLQLYKGNPGLKKMMRILTGPIDKIETISNDAKETIEALKGCYEERKKLKSGDDKLNFFSQNYNKKQMRKEVLEDIEERKHTYKAVLADCHERASNALEDLKSTCKKNYKRELPKEILEYLEGHVKNLDRKKESKAEAEAPPIIDRLQILTLYKQWAIDVKII